MIRNEMLMPFKKYVQSILKLLWDDETLMIEGTFKEIPSGKIVEGDIFEANLVGKGRNLEEIYKVYIKWFNHTKYSHEEERVFVSVKEHELQDQNIMEKKDG